MKAWLACSRAKLSTITPENFEQSLTELKTSSELEELLRLMATFPASLTYHAENFNERVFMDPSSSDWHEGQKLHVKRTQLVSGAYVATDWALYTCVLTDKALLLFSGASAGKQVPTAQIELERYEDYCPPTLRDFHVV